MEYTLFQDFARKIPRPAQPTGHPGPAQSSLIPEFGYVSYTYSLLMVYPSLLTIVDNFDHRVMW